MASFDYDLFVIGGGSGGVRAARMSAGLGAKVAITEEFRYGGTCVIRGCVPKKLMVYASSFPEMAKAARGYGWSADVGEHDWPAFTAKRASEIGRLEQVYRRNLENAGCEVYDRTGTIEDPHTVRLDDGRTFSTRHILIATGGAPFVPEMPGAELAITSDDIFDLTERPKSAVIIGGGYIAAEFAGILHGLGVETVLAYRGALFLRGFDTEVREHIAAEMRKKGMDLRFETDIARIDQAGDGLRRVTFTTGETAETEIVMMATGRKPSTGRLGLDAVGVATAKGGAIEVDDYSQTGVPSIWAVGDVTGRLELTPVAIREGAAFARTVFGAEPTRFDHELVPTAIFTQPEIGTIGLSEDDARDKGHEVDIYRTDFAAMYHGFAGIDERMLMKLVICHASGRVLGCHVVGDGAGELIQALGIAIKMGATKADFDRTCAVHPTAAEEIVTMDMPLPRSEGRRDAS